VLIGKSIDFLNVLIGKSIDFLNVLIGKSIDFLNYKKGIPHKTEYPFGLFS
jgi:hypothetical protein